ncbi:MAG: hypothetical protein IJ661_05985 [Lachnospiraceae bacterium]|nr:hypothetical protein [Lachnospiraceae bacterium]
MAYSLDEAEKLVKEGIELTSDIMDGIYSSKRKKIVVLLVVLLVVLAFGAAGIWIAGYPSYSVAIGVGGVLILIVLMVHGIKKLQGLKRELDALYHYMSY